MVQTTKPRLWNYKSGAKKGKLRPKAKQYLSFKLKEFHRREREEPKERERKSRIRNQLAFNSEYAISVRIIAIGEDITEGQLRVKMREFLMSNPALERINFETEGLEQEEVDGFEDIGLEEGKFYAEFNARGKTTFTEI